MKVELTEQERETLSAEIKDAFYEARDNGGTMHAAAKDERIFSATEAIIAARVRAAVDTALGRVMVVVVHLDRSDFMDRGVASDIRAAVAQGRKEVGL